MEPGSHHCTKESRLKGGPVYEVGGREWGLKSDVETLSEKLNGQGLMYHKDAQVTGRIAMCPFSNVS